MRVRVGDVQLIPVQLYMLILSVVKSLGKIAQMCKVNKISLFNMQ